MTSKPEFLKKYLRGPRRPRGPPVNQGGLKLRSDDELDGCLVPKQNASRARTKKTLFKVLRRDANGDKFLFADEEDEPELPDSEEEEVHVVGEDGQTLVLNEEEKKKVAQLIAKEEGWARPRGGSREPKSPKEGVTSEVENPEVDNAWKEVFAIDESLAERAVSPVAAPSPYDKRRARREIPADSALPVRQTDHSPSPQRRTTGKCIASRGRKTSQGEDLSPPRKGSDRDLSPPRRSQRSLSLGREGEDKDLSPPRRHASPAASLRGGGSSRGYDAHLDPVLERDAGDARDRDLSPPRRRRESAAQGDAEGDSNRGGEVPASRVIFRDREGRIISEEEWLTLEGTKGRKRPRERGPAPVLEWGSGLKQKEDLEAKKKEEEKIAKQPFARYDIDEEHDAELRARDRWDDPLAKAPSNTAQGLDRKQKGKEDVDREKKHQRPKCPHDAPPNRFGIKPGYRWDGVVRGNGYEEERLKALCRNS